MSDVQHSFITDISKALSPFDHTTFLGDCPVSGTIIFSRRVSETGDLRRITIGLPSQPKEFKNPSPNIGISSDTTAKIVTWRLLAITSSGRM